MSPLAPGPLDRTPLDRTPLDRARRFADSLALEIPVLLAPMAGACPPALSVAVTQAGGMGAAGCLMMQPDEIAAWTAAMRQGSNGAFQLNTWIPDAAPARDAAQEDRLRRFLADWGPEVPEDAAEATAPDFDAQCRAMLDAGPTVISSIMGLYPPAMVAAMKVRGIRWSATATTVDEALQAEAAGADMIVAQGAEAGGHRGAFLPAQAMDRAVGLFALLPAIVDAVRIPVIATGGIADARTAAAALILGASAVQIGTGLLRSPEAALPAAWRDALGQARPEDTVLTRAFSGRTGRALRTGYTEAATRGPDPAPYPVQRNLTAPMRAAALRDDDLDPLQAWAGQSARLAPDAPARETVARLWRETETLLRM